MSEARFSKASAATYLRGMVSSIALTKRFDTGNGTAQLRVARLVTSDQAKALVDRAIDYGRMVMFRSILEHLEEGRPVGGGAFADAAAYRLTKQAFIDALKTRAQVFVSLNGIKPEHGKSQLLHGLVFDNQPKDIEWQDALVDAAYEYGRREACLSAAAAAEDNFVSRETPASALDVPDSVVGQAPSSRRSSRPR